MTLGQAWGCKGLDQIAGAAMAEIYQQQLSSGWNGSLKIKRASTCHLPVCQALGPWIGAQHLLQECRLVYSLRQKCHDVALILLCSFQAPLQLADLLL